MCTVTFIPVNEKYFLTSNRDEKNSRLNAVPPAFYDHGKTRVIYPRDGNAGGTWIGLKENGDAAVLLNGAFIAHKPAYKYEKSRGLVFLDILAGKSPTGSFRKSFLELIEPFTMIIWENERLFELRWNGEEKFERQLNSNKPAIWSSVTLYDLLSIKKREEWFQKFLADHPFPTQQDILHFHRFSGEGQPYNDLVMQRDGTYSTISITSMLLTADRGSMKYLDLRQNKLFEKKVEFEMTQNRV